MLKYLRRIGKLPIDDSVLPWRSALRSLLQCVESILKVEKHDLSPASGTPMILFTDACPSGWGSVLFDSHGQIAVHCGPFDMEEDIQILEARAALRGVQRLPNQPPGSRVPLIMYIDNTSVVGGLSKGHHRNFICNVVLSQVSQELSEKGYLLVELHFVTSIANIADAPSRSFSHLRASQ